MKKSSYPYREPAEAWKVNEDGIELKYPIFHHDLSIPDDPIIKATIKEVLGDVDFWGWKGNEDDRIVDSTGKVFFTKFEETEGKMLFFIPVTRQSGVFPGGLERIMDLTEVKTIMTAGIDNNEVRIKENINELKSKINSLDSIEEILRVCSKYF
jgi:hypothetical protein